MKEKVSVVKDEYHQQKIPSIWRKTFEQIIESFVNQDYNLNEAIDSVGSISDSLASYIKENIEEFDETLVSLPQETWDTSVCQWMESYWEVLIDLYTLESGLCDLVLSIRVYERSESYYFEVQSLHIP
ncbi:DUF7668 domain-containing protein [Pseudoalteromonas luteoviolacea]|uniref:DUF7668 domain-containing protein n=1 Tax=Pseudoalteromonas luteoviolacea TaxID=43657 RepID=UPI001FFC6509|nr:hypothetical protein [Pseudoalteromonas luteoviolacea]